MNAAGVSLVVQIIHRSLRGAEKPCSDAVGQNTISFLGHGIIETAHTCLYMRHGNLKGMRRFCSG